MARSTGNLVNSIKLYSEDVDDLYDDTLKLGHSMSMLKDKDKSNQMEQQVSKKRKSEGKSRLSIPETQSSSINQTLDPH